ncbi:hypothetical protein ACFFX1_45545 [Dactylosporangium sucinum]|uniref:Uncharacterized protein n=1 Tax=Dactylosporangium sucinum TaxID=1424081 RepID=A0A917X0M4_9ACTN|nr:hypothetical protein [Dactylosporangium sucinum]GGM47719.1 hypothetical protein GCM10007977_056680 [Dactylosporangium sucinum]
MSDEVALLRRAFDIDELPPSTLDARAAVRAGRRRARVRAAVLAGATVVTVLATTVLVAQVTGGPRREPATPPAPWVRPSAVTSYAPGPASPPLGTCTYTDAQLPGVNGIFVLDPTGRIVVGSASEQGGGDLVRIENGRSERISPPGGASGSGPIAVNRAGDVLFRTGQGRLGLYRGGTFTTVPTPDGERLVSMAGLNNHGEVAMTLNSIERGGADVRAAVWRRDHPARPALLATPDGWSSSAIGINDDGTVAGYLQRPMNGSDATVATVPVVWDGAGTMRALPVPAEASDITTTDITGDWVLARGVRWNLRTGGVDVIEGILAERVDEHGRVFGEVPNMAPPHPGTWVNGTVALLPIDPEVPLGMMGVVSDDGSRIIGTATNETGGLRRLLWTCG